MAQTTQYFWKPTLQFQIANTSTYETIMFVLWKQIEIIPEDQPPYRPSGMARVTFASSEEAARALEERNRKYLGRRYVELREEW